MKHSIKKNPGSKVEIEIEISPEELDAFFEKAVFRLGENLEMEGFRKGKVPKDIVEKKIGKEAIMVEAADMAVQENYRKVVLENNIEAISKPEVEIIKLAQGNPFIFKANVSVLPEVALPDYKKIASQVKKNKVIIEEKEIEDSLNWLKKSRAKFSAKNTQAETGDFVEVEYWCPQIDELSQKAPKKDSFILGEGGFIPGFEEAITGMKSGDEKKEKIPIPQNSPLKAAGKEAEFNISMRSVQKVEFPEINDEFAKNVGKFDNLEALRKSIKAGITFEKEQAESQRARSEALEKIGKEAKMELPDFLVKHEQEHMLEDLKQSVADNLKIPFGDYLARIKKTEKEVLDSFLPKAQAKIKNYLILREIGRKEEISVSDQEITEEVNKILKSYPSEDKAKSDLDLQKLRDYTKEVIKNEKIFKLLENSVE
jgi:trigger factor